MPTALTHRYTSDALKLRGKHYGKDSPEFAAALLKSADWYRYTGEPGREIEQEEKALAVLEKHFGPPDSRLAIVLIRLATARISQHRHRDDAERAMQRAMALDFGPGSADACIRGEVLATSANQYFGKVRRLFLATPDLSFAAEFCLDPEEIVPICKARAEASVAR